MAAEATGRVPVNTNKVSQRGSRTLSRPERNTFNLYLIPRARQVPQGMKLLCTRIGRGGAFLLCSLVLTRGRMRGL